MAATFHPELSTTLAFIELLDLVANAKSLIAKPRKRPLHS